MTRSTWCNVAAVVALTVAVVLFSRGSLWPMLAADAVGAGFAVAAGRAMQSETPRSPSPDPEDLDE